MNHEPYEIERKFLIAPPDPLWLRAQEGYLCEEIVQTYLKSEPGEEMRVRKRGAAGRYVYTKTIKRPVCGAKRIEIEEEITREAYEALLAKADSALRPIEKTRRSFRYAGHIIEIDAYAFFADRMILEAELGAEDETLCLPPQIRVIREVTHDPRFKNAALAAAPDPSALL